MAIQRKKSRETPSQKKARLAKEKKAREAQKKQQAIDQAQSLEEQNATGGGSTEPAQGVIQDVGYSPFNQPVTKRAYTTPNIDPSELVGELEEPIFTAPSLDELEDSDQAQEQKHPEPKKEPTQFNQSFSELPNKEKKMGAEMMADVVLDGYSKLGTGIGNLAKISEGKMDREFADGTIEPSMQLPIDEMGNTVSVKDYIEEFNKEASDAFATTQEFKDNVRPPLIRVFEKRGIGMTDEQQLIYFFGTDLASKGVTAFGLKKSSDAILDNLRQQTEMMRRSQPQPTSSASEHYKTPEHQAQPQPDQVASKPEFVEPEEEKSNQRGVYSKKVVAESESIIIDESSGFAESQQAENMPEFGDKALLEDMQKLADREKLKNQSNKSNKKTK